MANRPKTFRKLVVQKLTSDFRDAVKIETVPMCDPKEEEICIKNKYVGINATDVNFTKGRYSADAKIPFDCGFEGIAEIVAVGSGVTNLQVGQIVGYLSSKRNAYAEYCCILAKDAFAIPTALPEFLALLLSGLTAATGLDKAGRIVNGETVLITAAAGGAGHIAVQWAKAAGCHVIGTCSTKEKEAILKDLGCDRIINYKTEDLGEILAKNYPNGIDVIWETIGGKVFETCFKNLAIKGRLLVVGGISGYKEDDKESHPSVDLSLLPSMLLMKSAAIQGYLLPHYADCFPTYYKYLVEHMLSEKIRTICDFGKAEESVGMEGIIDAVEYLHSGKSIGKVMVKI